MNLIDRLLGQVPPTRRMCLHVIGAFILAVGLSTASLAAGRTIETNPDDDWFEILSGDTLKPGDELILRAGVYSDRRRLVLSHRGTSQDPIVIRAAAGQRVVFNRPDASQNTFNLEGVQHLQMIGFEITGGSSAIRIGPIVKNGILMRQSSDIRLYELHIHHIGGVAVTCNFEGGLYERMVFARNHIHHTSRHGEAFYLGGNHSTAIFSHSIVEDNYIHDLKGPNVSQGDGIEIKQGSYGNRIIGNVIHDTNYPGITVYGTAGHERNLIESNLIWNTRDHGIQAAADAMIVKNFVADAGGSGIYSREHQEAIPGNLLLRENVVVANQNPAVRIIGGDDGALRPTIEVTGNLLMAGKGQPAIRIDNNAKVSVTNNRGQGDVTGTSVPATIGMSDRPLPQWPERFDNHPAWQHLDRAAVRELFE